MYIRKLLVILGPTATGKTDIAIDIAKKFNGAIISCDSRQVYKGLDIGSGKFPNKYSNIEKKNGLWKVDGVDIYLYDVANPVYQYSVAQFIKDVTLALDKINKSNKLPIIVGGTGLYLKAILEGLPNATVPINKSLRKSLEKLTREDLQKKLQQMDVYKWQNMNTSDKQNPRRLIRYIEIASNKQFAKETKPLVEGDILKIGLTAPREYLYKKVDDRVVNRLNNGMIQETKDLMNSGLTYKRLKELGLEYGLLAEYEQGHISELAGEQGLIIKMQNIIHGYVRRQLTWFKKEKDVLWIDVSKKDFFQIIEKKVSKWYH